jgi:hypothetical protein
LQIGFAGLGLSPGDRLVVPEAGAGAAAGWRIVERLVARDGVRLRLVRVPAEGSAEAVGESGRALAQPLVPAGPTRIDLFEPPIPPDGGDTAALWIVASGEAGWRGAELAELRAGDPVPLGRADWPIAAGVLQAPLPPGPVGLWDEQAEIHLSVAPDPERLFESRSAMDVLAGANLLLIGEELVQYRDATMVSPGRMRLRRLLRGCFGTAPAGAPADTRVVTVAPGAVLRRPVGADSVGASIALLAEGAGDPPGGTPATWIVTGAGLAPLAPVHLRAWREADGRIEARWIARGRTALAWDGPEPAHPACLFRLRVGGEVRLERLVTGGAASVSVAEQLALFGGPAPGATVEVEALGPGPVALRRSAAVGV